MIASDRKAGWPPPAAGRPIPALAARLMAGSVLVLSAGSQRRTPCRPPKARVDADRAAARFTDPIREQTGAGSVLGALASSIEEAIRRASAPVWIREGGR